MAKERGVIMPVIRNFLNSFMPRKSKVRFVGEDYHGTKYYEDPERLRNRGRSYEPADPENLHPEIPPEWEAWLRYRRANPPTPEEVMANYELMMTKKKNAAELEIQYNKEKGKTVEAIPSKPQLNFPTYDEYSNYGQNYQIKPKK
ncbi:NADH-ubiquinone oxidoreductase assembly factor N7BML [Chelonus insularis]|uniref:NADH-ubiquinone oxidoreductase assembly factor N7BML n=1 Tax=Chelonus insularis TaxID=460826 RepID=UPI00158E313D|nr:NADH-ubiquinone oxidoreductase assembly factor N7BML [Chelonus insularis]XP_034948078.1 NADH-ubiquinone oxidoreductase assembly factor N7BML [Chelonus insularis]